MARGDYHGGFQHPLRAFFIGTGLLVLLVGGWVVGVEAGGPPTAAGQKTHLVKVFGQPKLHVVTVSKPVVSTVVSGPTTKVIKGIGKTRVVVIHTVNGDQRGYLPIDQVPALTAAAATAPLTVYVQDPNPITETVTETATETQTETVTETQTDTVTETAPPTSSATSSGSSTP